MGRNSTTHGFTGFGATTCPRKREVGEQGDRNDVFYELEDLPLKARVYNFELKGSARLSSAPGFPVVRRFEEMPAANVEGPLHATRRRGSMRLKMDGSSEPTVGSLVGHFTTSAGEAMSRRSPKGWHLRAFFPVGDELYVLEGSDHLHSHRNSAKAGQAS